ncbi:MAG TPA: hypothetical protein VF549_20345 [Solirubrobacteraceae bacterium]
MTDHEDVGSPAAEHEEIGSRAARWAAVAWLALLGAAAVTVGAHDTAVGHEISVRLTGTAILAAGLLLIAGAVGFRKSDPQGDALATVAALLGAALGVMAFVAQAVNDDPDSRLVLWAAIVLVSVAVWWFVRWQMTDEERKQGIFSRLPVLKSTVAVGLLISFAQFWYSTIYTPTLEPVSLTVEPKFEAPEKRGNRLVVRGTVTVRNTSKSRIIVVASSLMVSVDRVGRKPVIDGFDKAKREANAERRDAAARYPLTGAVEILRGRFVSDDFYFEAGETVTRPFIAWVPYDRERHYDVARVDVSFVGTRPSIGSVEDDAAIRKTNIEGGLAVTRSIPADGWLDSLTRADRFLIVRYADSPFGAHDEFAPYDVGFDRRRSTDPPDDFSDRMRRVYGLNSFDGAAVVPLPPFPTSAGAGR